MNPEPATLAQEQQRVIGMQPLPRYAPVPKPMQSEFLKHGSGYNPDTYWESTEASYPHYPTVRHRKRFILNAIACAKLPPGFTVFDFGCGEASLLKSIQAKFRLLDDQLGGCDVSGRAVVSAKMKLKSPYLFHALYPDLPRTFDVMICSEVIEHTRDYKKILEWMHANLAPGGLLILTTQAGKIHGSDRYTGHTQHFDRRELTNLLISIGYKIEQSYLWGWPFFTLQKYMTDFRFEQIQANYLEGSLSLRKKIIFSLAYLAYCLHDLIPFGPQIYITARKV